MKRVNGLFERIMTWDNLLAATRLASQGKRRNAETQQFCRALSDNLRRIQHELQSGSFRFGRFHQFVIHDPKERLITAPCFEERVVHHAIMNVCEPYFEKLLIDDTFACRKGRGRLAALSRAQFFSHRHSQHFANFYLGEFDRFVKEQLAIKGYVRYMDDSLLWGNSRAELHQVYSALTTFMRETLHLEIKRPIVASVKRGIDFLGCRLFPNFMILNCRSRRRFRRRLRDLTNKNCSGEISLIEYQQKTVAAIAFSRAGGVRSWKFRRMVIESISADD